MFLEGADGDMEGGWILDEVVSACRRGPEQASIEFPTELDVGRADRSDEAKADTCRIAIGHTYGYVGLCEKNRTAVIKERATD